MREAPPVPAPAPVPAPVPARAATPEDLRAAYRILLGREADPDGLRHYGERMDGGDLTLDDLRRDLTGSSEHRARAAAALRIVDVGGVQVVVDPDEPEFGAALAAHGAWEPHIARLVVEGLAAGDTFVDIGANVGVMALQAARAVGPSGRVVAVEPKPDNVQLLLRGVHANGFGHVVVLPVAASDRARVVRLRGGSNAHLELGEGAEPGDFVQALAADALLAGEARVDLVKIDIEGHEPSALEGLDKTLRRFRPRVLCEFNPRCLADHAGVRPPAFAATLFARFGAVSAVEYDGRETTLADASELMALWRVRNAAAVAEGRLPDGMVHFDLRLEAPRP